jgi:hypothetical protein
MMSSEPPERHWPAQRTDLLHIKLDDGTIVGDSPTLLRAVRAIRASVVHGVGPLTRWLTAGPGPAAIGCRILPGFGFQVARGATLSVRYDR